MKRRLIYVTLFIAETFVPWIQPKDHYILNTICLSST
jgi:hypothetical protein